MADTPRELNEYAHVVEHRELNGEYEYCWKEIAICKTFKQAAFILSKLLDEKYQARYINAALAK